MKALSKAYFNFLCVCAIFLLSACASKDLPRPSSVQQSFPEISVEPDVKKLIVQGKEYLKKRQFNKAESIFKQVSERKPQLVSPLLNLAVAYMQQHRLLEAEAVLRQALRKRSNMAEIYNMLGVVLRKQGRFADAETAYRYALQIDGKYADAHMNIAILYDLYMLDYEKAQRHYRAFAELEPKQQKQVNAWLTDMLQRAQVSN